MTSDNHVFMGVVGISFLVAAAVGVARIAYLARTGRDPNYKNFVTTLVLTLGVFLIGAVIAWIVDPPHSVPKQEVRICQGPLVWFDVGVDGDGLGAILECAACSYIVVTGNMHDAAHQYTPLPREGLAHG